MQTLRILYHHTSLHARLYKDAEKKMKAATFAQSSQLKILDFCHNLVVSKITTSAHAKEQQGYLDRSEDQD